MWKEKHRLSGLYEFCEKSGKSKASIAREMGVAPQYLNEIIHYNRPLSVPHIVPFCKATGISPNELLGWEGEDDGYVHQS